MFSSSQYLKQMFRSLGRTAVTAIVLCMAGASFIEAQIPGYIAKSAKPSTAETVSMIQLISNPQQYDGKQIQLIGFLRAEFEQNALYLHREDYDQGIQKNALWINLPHEMTEQQMRVLDMHYVICLATFDASRHGHMNAFTGELKDVQRLQMWSSDNRRTPSGPAKLQQ